MAIEGINTLSELIAHITVRGDIAWSEMDQQSFLEWANGRFAKDPTDNQQVISTIQSENLIASITTLYNYFTTTRSPVMEAQFAIGIVNEYALQVQRNKADTPGEQAGAGFANHPISLT